MEIGNASGVNQYLNIQSTDTQKTPLRDPNIEASNTTPNQEGGEEAQPAFQVNLTREAQDLLAKEEGTEQPQPEQASEATALEAPAANGNQPGPGKIVDLTA